MENKLECPNCLKQTVSVFHQAKNVPTNSCILLSSQEEALSYPQGDIQLGFCDHCGFIFNTAFDEKLTEYSGRYEETQGFSPTFTRFHQQLAEDLTKQYGLDNKHIIEIGCGKGEFLILLCQQGRNSGLGFDPGYRTDRTAGHVPPGVEFITDFYSEKYSNMPADFYCCKMTLEHIPKTANFIQTVRQAIDKQLDATVFFMIPETLRILETCAFEDIYYEHCSYFTPYSLNYLFANSGFEVQEIGNLYAGQYLTIVAKPSVNGSSTHRVTVDKQLTDIKQLVEDFSNKFSSKKQYWEKLLVNGYKEKKKIILWGSGSKAVSLLTTLDINNAIEYVVDINPNRHDYYMPITGQKIVSPDFLKTYQPDSVIIMNEIYKQEINEMLAGMELHPEIFTL